MGPGVKPRGEVGVCVCVWVCVALGVAEAYLTAPGTMNTVAGLDCPGALDSVLAPPMAGRRKSEVLHAVPPCFWGHTSIRQSRPPVSAASGKLAVSPVMCLGRSEEHTSELQSLMRISYAVFCLKKK